MHDPKGKGFLNFYGACEPGIGKIQRIARPVASPCLTGLPGLQFWL